MDLHQSLAQILCFRKTSSTNNQQHPKKSISSSHQTLLIPQSKQPSNQKNWENHPRNWPFFDVFGASLGIPQVMIPLDGIKNPAPLSAKNVTLLRVLTDLQALLAARCLRATKGKLEPRSWKNHGKIINKYRGFE